MYYFPIFVLRFCCFSESCLIRDRSFLERTFCRCFVQTFGLKNKTNFIQWCGGGKSYTFRKFNSGSFASSLQVEVVCLFSKTWLFRATYIKLVCPQAIMAVAVSPSASQIISIYNFSSIFSFSPIEIACESISFYPLLRRQECCLLRLPIDIRIFRLMPLRR